VFNYHWCTVQTWRFLTILSLHKVTLVLWYLLWHILVYIVYLHAGLANGIPVITDKITVIAEAPTANSFLYNARINSRLAFQTRHTAASILLRKATRWQQTTLLLVLPLQSPPASNAPATHTYDHPFVSSTSTSVGKITNITNVETKYVLKIIVYN